MDGKWHHIWHQSDLKTFEMCPERARKIWAGEVSDPESDAAVLGTACHNAVERLLLPADPESYDHCYPVERCEESYDLLHDYFEQELTELSPAIEKWNSYGSVDKMRDMGTSKLDAWYEEIYNGLTPMHVELPFKKLLFEDDERVVHMEGRIDLIDSNLGIVDWKFPKRDYTRDKWQYDRWDVQSTVYSWAVDQMKGELKRDFEEHAMTFFVVHGKSGVSQMRIDRSPQDWEFLKRKVEALSRLVERSDMEVWTLNDAGWWCSEKWAPCWHLCKGKETYG